MSSILENSYLREAHRRMALEMDADILLGPYGMQQAYHEQGLRPAFVWSVILRHPVLWWRAWRWRFKCALTGHPWRVQRIGDGPRPHYKVICQRCDTEAARFNDPRTLA